MLTIKNLYVELNKKEVLKNINLEIKNGETHILFGPNGSGKTSLLLTIMGYPQYKITKGEIIFNGKVINNLSIEERVNLGIGIFFQKPPVIKGVKLEDLINNITKKFSNSIDISKLNKKLNLSHLLPRDINHGFSGGEIKRSELIQLIAQNPEFIMFDEPESGVDIENMKIIGEQIKILLERNLKKENRRKSALIITHTGYILDFVDADKGYTLIDGKLLCNHDPEVLFTQIQKHGFKECELCKGIKRL